MWRLVAHLWIFFLSTLSAVGADLPPSSQAPTIDLVIPLEQGRFYSRRDVLRELKLRLGAEIDPQAVADKRFELTSGERVALRLAAEAGLLEVRFEPERLVLGVPDREDPRVRRRNRQRIASLLGVHLDEWSKDHGLHIPDGFRPDARTVVLIHGLEATARTMHPLKSAFESFGAQTLLFNYPNDGAPAVAGEHLARDLAALAKQHPRSRVVLIGHSLGGLVARHALETAGINPGNVSDLVCLATPHTGSSLACQHALLELIVEGLPNGLQSDVMLQSGLGEAAIDLRPGSRFLTELNRQKRPPDIRYHMAVGVRSVMTGEQQKKISGQLADFLEGRGASPATRRNIQRTVELPELRHGAGDGAVTIESATMARADTVRQFDRTHCGLIEFELARPETQVVFRWILETLRWE